MARRARLARLGATREGRRVQVRVRRGVFVVVAAEARGRAGTLRREVVAECHDRSGSERNRKSHGKYGFTTQLRSQCIGSA